MTLYVRVKDDVVDAEVEVGGESPADGAEQAARRGAGGGGVEALEHGLGGAVRGVPRGRALRQEGVDVPVLDRRRRHSASLGLTDWLVEREMDGTRRRWKGGEGEKKMAGREGALAFIEGDAAVDDGGTPGKAGWETAGSTRFRQHLVTCWERNWAAAHQRNWVAMQGFGGRRRRSSSPPAPVLRRSPPLHTSTSSLAWLSGTSPSPFFAGCSFPVLHQQRPPEARARQKARLSAFCSTSPGTPLAFFPSFLLAC
nr:unnamed protein product [Digitaria exilis]